MTGAFYDLPERVDEAKDNGKSGVSDHVTVTWIWQIDLVILAFPGLPQPAQIALLATELVVFGAWIAAWFSVIFTPTEVWSASGQRKWVIVLALIFLGPILASLAYWLGFRRALMRRTFVRGSSLPD